MHRNGALVWRGNASRVSSRSRDSSVPDHEVVAVAGRGEVAVHHRGLQQVAGLRLRQLLAQHRADAVFERGVVLAVFGPVAPLVAEQRGLVDERRRCRRCARPFTTREPVNGGTKISLSSSTSGERAGRSTAARRRRACRRARATTATARATRTARGPSRGRRRSSPRRTAPRRSITCRPSNASLP